MKRLINTKLFCILENMDGTFKPSKQDTKSVYDDFVDKVTSLFTLAQEDAPTYFTLHYTRLELERLQISLTDEGAEKKCTNPKLYHSLPVVSIYCPAIRDFHPELLLQSS